MFCAGHSRGSATIAGDSGGSLTVQVQENKNIWIQSKDFSYNNSNVLI